jgi:hypothetical protein
VPVVAVEVLAILAVEVVAAQPLQPTPVVVAVVADPVIQTLDQHL